jgi:membrane protein
VKRVQSAVDPNKETRLGLVIRALMRYAEDGMAERAPTLAYYGILSVFPSLMLGFALIRLVGGDGAPDDIASYARAHGASGEVAGALRSATRTARAAPGPTAGAVGFLGSLTLIYGASRAFTATGRAIDAIGGRTRTSRSLKRRAEDMGWTLLLLLFSIAAVLLLTVSGGVLEDLLGLVGLSGAAVTVWSVARLPVACALGLFIVALVYWAAPSRRPPRFRLITPGALVAIATLLLATVGFDVYVATFASYNTTYGASAGIVVLLLWIWLAGSIVLFGAELDAVLDGARLNEAPASP